ncbi:MAG: tRNA pseudouridine(55) synthase TruB [SAR202 cluster bacterium Io17-Chloro-G9]|nr:MAG: tRNA pseudouridine(55) synthase TruB [SAR202 cluster bacterium Io17-Chloro-G9]
MTRNRNNSRTSVNGFLNLYKPSGITSMDALRQVKRITGQRHKVGHGGTMDPLARGVLPVCFGQATRLMDWVVGGRKKYLMEIAFGVTTTTYDKEGEVVKTGDTSELTLEQIQNSLRTFDGVIEQTPPMYSAIKVGGQRLYKLARAGIEVERATRPVEIYDIRVVESNLPNLVLEVESGRGAYMRSLAHDLGELLGCGAHVADLERLSCGAFKTESALTLEQLQPGDEKQTAWESNLLPVDWVLQDLQSISMGPQAEQYLRHGQTVSLGQPQKDAGYMEQFRAYSSDGRFLAVVRFDRAGNSWRPVKVFEIETPSPHAPAPA